MASALTVLLLGCWLAGRSGVSGPWWGQGLGELPRNGEPHPGGPTDGGDGGGYSCQYSTKWDSPVWSEPSDPVQLVVADSFHMRGGGCHWKDARLAWWGHGLGELPRNREPHRGGPTDGGDGGGYSCQYSTKWDSPVWSEPSDPVQLVVADSFHMWGGGCHWKDARLAWWGQGLGELPRNGEPHRGGPTDGGDGGGYSCQYSTKWDSPVWSEPSDPVQLVVAGGTKLTQPGTMLAPTRPGSTGPGSSTGGRKSPSTPPEAAEGAAAPLDFTNANIARLVLGTVVLLILGLILDLAVQGRESPRG
ncbi:unnamed protein product [Lepidochelys olivacea]